MIKGEAEGFGVLCCHLSLFIECIVLILNLSHPIFVVFCSTIDAKCKSDGSSTQTSPNYNFLSSSVVEKPLEPSLRVP